MDDHIKYCNERREQDRREADKTQTELRERIIRAEQDILNQRDNFKAFKSEDFGELKKEVHSMRNELNTKIDDLQAAVAKININIAKWMGGLSVALYVLNLVVEQVMK